MDSTPPPPHTSYSSCSVAAAPSFVAGPSFSSCSPRGLMSTALLGSQSQRRSSLYPQPLPNRIASHSSSSSSSRSRQVPPPSPAAGGSRGRSQAAAMYEEMCLIRRTSVEFFAHLDAVEEAHRATRIFRRRQPQLLHHQARPSSSSTMTSSGLPPLPPRGTFSRHNTPSSSRQGQQARPSSSSATSLNLPGGGSIPGFAPWPSSSTSGRLDLMPNGNIFGYSPSFPQLQQARPSSTTSRLPQLPGASFSGYAPSPSQQQHQHAWPSSLSVTSARIDLPNETVFGNAPSLSPQQHQAESAPGLPPLPGSFSEYAQPSPVSYHYQQEPWKATLAGSSSADPAQSWSNNTTSGTGFVQPSSSSGQYELPSLPPSLLPVQQEPVESSDCCLDTTDDIDAIMASLEEPSTGLEGVHLLDSSSSGGIGLSAWNSASTRSCDKNMEAIQGAASKMSMESPDPITMPKLMLGGMDSQRVPPQSLASPVAGARSSMSATGGNGNLFTDSEMEKVMKDKCLKELVNTYPKRVKSILNKRASTAKLTAPKEKCAQDLKRQYEAQQINNLSLNSRVRQEQERFVELTNQNIEMETRLQQLEVKAKMGAAEYEALMALIESSKHVDVSGLC